MAFRASNILPAQGYQNAKIEALAIKDYAERVQNQLAGTVPSTVIINIVSVLMTKKDTLTAIQTIPGIVQYARDQEDDPLYDVVAEFNALKAEIDTVVAWVKTNFPADGSGYLLARQWNTNNTVDRNFPPAQTTGLVTVLQGLIDQVT